jgi:hypothetical protein
MIIHIVHKFGQLFLKEYMKTSYDINLYLLVLMTTKDQLATLTIYSIYFTS